MQPMLRAAQRARAGAMGGTQQSKHEEQEHAPDDGKNKKAESDRVPFLSGYGRYARKKDEEYPQQDCQAQSREAGLERGGPSWICTCYEQVTR